MFKSAVFVFGLVNVEKIEWGPLFPYKSPHKQQSLAISRIVEFFERNIWENSVFLLQAPTGVGKSAIGVTVARYFNKKHGFGANYLVHNKFLEGQVVGEFSGEVAHTLGRSNFKCIRSGGTCAVGPCQTRRAGGEPCEHCPTVDQTASQDAEAKYQSIDISNVEFDLTKGEFTDIYTHWANSYYWNSNSHCNYWDAKANAVKSPIALHNYSYYALEQRSGRSFSKRWLLICDEGHKIEDAILGMVGFSVSYRDVNRFGIPLVLKKKGIAEWHKNVTAVSTYIKSDDFRASVKSVIYHKMNKDLSDEDFSKTNSYADEEYSLLNDAETLAENMEFFVKDDPEQWIVDYVMSEGVVESVSFKPIDVHLYARKTLFSQSLKILVMSATLLSREMMVKSLGLEDFEFDGRLEYLDLDTPFPAEHRVFTYIPIVKMSYDQSDEDLQKMVNAIKGIMMRHKGVRGVIHTKSYALAAAIAKGVGGSRVITHDSKTRASAIVKFMKSVGNEVLVSPSVEEGVDFKGDICRFIIICKVPFLNLGDPQIKAHMRADGDWYAWKTVQTVIQMAGRGVRSVEDYCDTYVLDSNFGRIYSEYRDFFPPWFQSAVKIIKG